MTNDANIRLECLKPAERWAQPSGEEVREVLRLAGLTGGKAAKVLGLEKLLHRYPRELSGGMLRRVAFARAIVMEARLKAAEGDMDSALKLLDTVLAREPAEGPGAPLPTVERQRDLLRYAASPRYRAARKFLGF